MFSRLQRRRSNLQDLGRLSKSCPAVDSPGAPDDDTESGSSGTGSSSSLRHSPSESSEDISPPVSRAEKQLVRYSLRRAKQRELEQKRKMEENKISMDDYLGKQAQFTLWLLEEQKKQMKDLSSPKRKTYFKMFVRLWNKRHLPVKFYESRLSRHMDDEETMDEEKNPVHLHRPKFSLLQNSPVLDPTIFPHTIDLSSDSIALGTPSPFSTFGKSTPSSVGTPFRFSADCAKVSEKSVVRNRAVFRFGENKENTAHFSLPVTAACGQSLRTATISPRKKMMTACQDRSLDRMIVSWSPRGQPRLNPVQVPRCPSPFQRNTTEQNVSPATEDMTVVNSHIPDGFSTFSHSPDHYCQVKDFVDSDSPSYAEIPFAYSPRVLKESGNRVCRRRSCSLDEMPLYATPSRQAGEGQRRQVRTVFEKDLSTSPPPLPPKRFDPHVEGLGIPFSAPNTGRKLKHGADGSVPLSSKTDENDLDIWEEEAKKSGKKKAKGKLPWFSKKTTSRRRSRSCEVLSPLPDTVATRGVSQKEGSTDEFPLVELERSPTLSRRVLTRPHKLPARQAGGVQKAKFELMEYTSSPMRPGTSATAAKPLTVVDGLKRGSLLRRRSRSLEHVYSPFLGQPRCSQNDSIGRGRFESDQQPATGLGETGLADSEIPSKAGCEDYDQVKSDVRKELSNMVSKILQLSAPENTTPEKQSLSMEVQLEELQSSPKRFGQAENPQEASASKMPKAAVKPGQDSAFTEFGTHTLNPHSVASSITLESDSQTSKTSEVPSCWTTKFMQKTDRAVEDKTREPTPPGLDFPGHKESTEHSVSFQTAAFSIPLPTLRGIQPHEAQSSVEAPPISTISQDVNFAVFHQATLRHTTDKAHEIPSYREAVKQPSSSVCVASTPARPVVSGVCRPLHAVSLSAADQTELASCLTPPKTKRPQRRRSRSVDETYSQKMFTVFKDTDHHPQSGSTKVSAPSVSKPGGQTVHSVIRFNPSTPAHVEVKIGNALASEPTRHGNLKVSAPSPQSQAPAATVQLVSEPSSSCVEALVSGCSQPVLSQQTDQIIKKRQPPQVAPKYLSQTQSKGKHQPAQPATTTEPSQVMEGKQRGQQVLPQSSQKQQAAEQGTQVPSVKDILQRFGGSFRSVRSNRRRSRSVGDLTALQDQDSSSVSAQTGGTGFASVRAFWDRQRGKAAHERPGVTLQRKPSTMRRLQQQLYGETPEMQNSGTACSVLNEHSDSSTAGTHLAQVSEAKKGQAQVQEVNKEDRPSELSCQPEHTVKQHAALSEAQNKNASEKVDEKTEMQKSPFVTVRRQPSRKKTVESPCYNNSEQRTATMDNPLTRDNNSRQMPSEMTSANTCINDEKTKFTEKSVRGKQPVDVALKKNTSPVQVPNVTPSSTKDLILGKKAEENAVGIKEEMPSTNTTGQKKKPGPPPKPMPKPKRPLLAASLQCSGVRPVQTESVHNTQNQSPFESSRQMSSVNKTRKRHSEEMDQPAVPKKLNAVDKVGEHRGLVTRSNSRGQMKALEDSPEQSSNLADVDGLKEEKRKNEVQKKTRSVKRCSSEKIDHNDSSPVKRSNSTKDETKHLAVPRRQNGTGRNDSLVQHSNSTKGERKAAAIPRRQSSGKEAKKPAIVTRQGSGRQVDKHSPLVKRKSSGKDGKSNSSAVRRQSSGKDCKSNSSAVRRQSSGKEAIFRTATPRRRSSCIKVVTTKTQDTKTLGSSACRDNSEISTQVHRSSSRRGQPDCSESGKRQGDTLHRNNPESGKRQGDTLHINNPRQSSCMEEHTMSPIAVKPCGSVGRDVKNSSPVKRFNSTREETKMHSASSLVKRFNSLRDDTTSSRAKRRSGNSLRGTPVTKRTSSANRNSRRESGKVKRVDSGRCRKDGETADNQGGTPSRTGSFRKQGANPPQSPTFMRIKRRLGVFDEDCSDDSSSEEISGISARKAVLVLQKTQAHASAELGASHQSPELGSSDQGSRLPGQMQSSDAAAGLKHHHVSTSASLVEDQPDNNDVSMETDIDLWTEQSEPVRVTKHSGTAV